jgi:hypothetical protein
MLPTTADGYPSYFAHGNSSIAAEPPRRSYAGWVADVFSPCIGGLHRYLPSRRDAGSSYFRSLWSTRIQSLGHLLAGIQSEAIPTWGGFLPQCGTANSIGPAAAFTYERCSRGSRTQPYLQETAFPGAGRGWPWTGASMIYQREAHHTVYTACRLIWTGSRAFPSTQPHSLS